MSGYPLHPDHGSTDWKAECARLSNENRELREENGRLKKLIDTINKE